MQTNRLERLAATMAAQGLAAVVLMPDANLRYLSGLAFHHGKRITLLIIPANGDPPAFVIPALEVSQAQHNALIPMRYFAWSDADGPAQALRDALEATIGAARGPVGVEYTTMRVMELRALEQAAPGLQTVDAIPLLSSLRMVKDQEEQAAMAEAARIIDVALGRLIAQIRVGMTERQISALWTREIMAAGAEGESFENIVASGPNSANPHHNNSDRPVQAGDLIILDGGARYGGYASDITRTIAIGEPGAEARRIYALVQAANAAGRAAVRPGATGEQIDDAARQVIVDGGYGDYFIHRTGHGLGLETHEEPYIVAGSRAPLPAGVTFTVEPGIYVQGVGGVRIEDDMMVTEAGGASLTGFERDLLVLPA